MFKLTPREQKLVILLGCLLLLGLVLRFTLPDPDGVAIVKGGENVAAVGNNPGSNNPGAVEENALVEDNKIAVHVAGAVSRPGVYYVAEGSRLYEAVEEAGGYLEDADLNRVNLAQPLFDGQRVEIPLKNPGEPGSAAVPGADGENLSLASEQDRVNINTASRAELETLPGIGAVKAASIVSYRERHGPFQRIEDLVKVSGIGEKTVENIRDLITVY